MSQLPPWLQSPAGSKEVPRSQTTPPPAPRISTLSRAPGPASAAVPDAGSAPETASAPTVSRPASRLPEEGWRLPREAFSKPSTQRAPSSVPNQTTQPPSTAGSQQNRFAEPAPPPRTVDVPRIALLLPLSGPSAAVGRHLLNAAQLALFDFADTNFELLPHDTKGTPAGAVEAAALAIGDGASLILGPLLSASVQAVTPAARAAGVNVISFSSDRAVAGDGVFTMGFLPADQIRRVVQYAGTRRLERFAALVPDDTYGLRVVDALYKAAAENGLVVTDLSYYNPQTIDFAPIIRRLANYDTRRQTLLDQKAALEGRDDEVAQQALKRLENAETLGEVPFDALLIAEGGKRLQAIAALLPYYDIDPKKIRMLGTGQWDAPGLGAEPALVGGWYAAPPPAARLEFTLRYKATYDEEPHRLATLAYDATALAAVLAQGEGGFGFAAITAPQGFVGRDGIFRFLPDGTAQRGLSIIEVRERDTVIVDDAPTSFTSRVN